MRFLKVTGLVVVMMFGAVMMLGVLSLRGLPVRGGSGSTISGDVNCDGQVDISDAIYIIQHQFFGGSAPCALAQDDFATKEDLDALASRLAALESASKRRPLTATGVYTGDGKYPRTISTGLPGKLRDLHVFINDDQDSQVFPDHASRDWIDSEGPSQNGITVMGTDLVLQDERFQTNLSGRIYAWIATATEE